MHDPHTCDHNHSIWTGVLTRLPFLAGAGVLLHLAVHTFCLVWGLPCP